MTSSLETEAKFSIPDQKTFEELQQLSHLEEFQLEAVGTKEITDRYLDTADRHILEAGYALRIRQVNEQRVVYLKSLTPPENHIHRRQEFEVTLDSNQAVDGEQPDTWPESEAKTMALEITAGQALELLFVLNQTRHQFDVLLEERLVLELCLDVVFLDGDESPDFLELEAELREQGTEEDLDRFVEVLQDKWPLEPQSSSKFERGLDAKFGSDPEGK